MKGKHELWKCPNCVHSTCVKSFGGGGGGGGLIVETNCILEYKPRPHFRRDVVYKMGGRINGTLRYMWQSWVEIKHYSVAYFDRVTAFKVLQPGTSVKGGAHMHYVDLSGIHASSLRV